jgi:ABC-2 type transport system permease protein
VRILRQLAADHRSVAMILAVPCLVITLMYFMFENAPHRPGAPTPFNNACLILLGVFPLFVMFIITAITMQRERASGTLERILTTPLRRLDLLIAYGTAFSVAAAAARLRHRGQPAVGVRDRGRQRRIGRRLGPAL